LLAKYGKANGPDRISATYGGKAWLDGETIVHLNDVNGEVSITFLWVDDPMFKRLTNAGKKSNAVLKAYERIWKETRNWDRMLAAFDAWFKENGAPFEGYSIQDDGSLVLSLKDGPLEYIRIKGLPPRDDEEAKKRRAEKEAAELRYKENDNRFGELLQGVTLLLDKQFDELSWHSGLDRQCRMTLCANQRDERGWRLLPNSKACKALCIEDVSARCERALKEIREHIATHGAEMKERFQSIGYTSGPALKAVHHLGKRRSKFERACKEQCAALETLLQPILQRPPR
jgi:hypothetical protein